MSLAAKEKNPAEAGFVAPTGTDHCGDNPGGPGGDLNQGDLLGGIVAPVVVVPLALTIQEGPRVRDPRHVETGQLLASLANARVVLRVVRHERCMVLSNSCDNARGFDLLHAPIDVFPLVEEEQHQWPQVSNAATGTANPKRLYLPGAPEFGLQRSEINFQKIYLSSLKSTRRDGSGSASHVSPVLPQKRNITWRGHFLYGSVVTRGKT